MGNYLNPGNEKFRRMIQSEIYVDKTGMIKYTNSVLDTAQNYVCVSRPRRFGKSMAANMLTAYYSRGCNSKELFGKFEIAKDKDFEKYLNQYNTIFLNMQEFLSRSHKVEELINRVKKLVIRDLKMEYPEVDYFDDTDLIESMQDVYAQTQCPFVVIIDEWDCIFREYKKDKEAQEKYLDFLRDLLKDKACIYLSYMTGILPIKKYGTHSALNMFDEFSMINPGPLACYVGFTEKEVFQVLENNRLSSEKENIRYWYDGFSFGKRKDIYNPWSITKYLDTGEYGTYWADTSGNVLVSNLIRQSPAKIKSEMEDLLQGRTICTDLDEQVIFEQLGRKRGAIWSLLLASGYLKVDRYEMDNRTGKRQYYLKITNHETMLMFEKMIEDWFSEEDSAYGNFKDALIAGDLDYMNQFMNQVALQTFSSFDTGNKPSEEQEPERFYHGFVLGLIVDLAEKYRITSNRESGFGRYDVVMEPLKENLDAIVMEFKVQNMKKEKSLEQTVENALRQIDEKEYDTELLARGIKKERIRHYGFAFRGKKVLIGTEE